ncbi:helix-turn-helix domain-containing protein [Endozoicomonas sp. 8E]|uniref:helix-turn-helix domain-containing protein n=1 Tax=Endozoicomonas sp. 8E TaxID=3035692 RepID=UPI0029394096|nr:helix-turn-helix domain-containing protein [Endozoicomonas sp. 8E]WOG29525.1 helix-turn-helix domain-containing protein [Endozoicomonas sp. 8E]
MPEQEQLLAQTFGCARFVYSSASKPLTVLKKNPGYPWLQVVFSLPVQQSRRHQQTAFKNFRESRAKSTVFSTRDT